jgi:hypothetical protein
MWLHPKHTLLLQLQVLNWCKLAHARRDMVALVLLLVQPSFVHALSRFATLVTERYGHTVHHAAGRSFWILREETFGFDDRQCGHGCVIRGGRCSLTFGTSTRGGWRLGLGHSFGLAGQTA